MSNAPNWYQPPSPQPGSGVYAPPPHGYGYGAGGVVYGTFGIRFGARVVDTLVGMVVGFASGLVAGVAMVVLRSPGEVAAHKPGISFIGLGLSIFGSLAYHALSEGIGGATIGKLACGLRVRSADLSPPTLGAGILRTLAYWIDAFFFGLVAYSVMSKSMTQQRLGDKWGKTVVVRASSLPPGALAQPSPVGGLMAGLAVWLLCSIASQLVPFLL
jgi:uncharacterized RDD family membrane protein YckC